MLRRHRFALTSLFPAVLAAGCGFGTGGVVAAVAGGGGATNAPSTITGLLVLDGKRSPATVRLVLNDFEADRAIVEFAYVVPGQGERPLTKVPQNPVTLAGSAAGLAHEFAWDFAGEQGLGPQFTAGVQVIARIRGAGTQATVAGLGNDAPAVDQIVVPANEIAGVVPLTFAVRDTSGDAVDVLAEFHVAGEPADQWHRARPAGTDAAPTGPQLQGVVAPAGGASLTFFWDTDTRDGAGQPLGDLVDLERDIVFRFTAADATDVAAPVVSATFHVDNNDTPAVTIGDGAALLNGDAVRGIPVPFQTSDQEGDPVRVVFQWALTGDVFPSLGTTDVAALVTLLRDPVYRRNKHVCTPYRYAVGGKPVAVDATHVRLHELARPGASWLAARDLVGTELELLRPPAGEVAQLAAGWSANALASPVAALPFGDGLSVLVLDVRGAASTVVEIDLQTGAVVRTLATGLAGAGTAMATMPDGVSALVATDDAGTWRLFVVGPLGATGVAAGTTPAAPLRGICALADTAAVATAADRLVRIDWKDATVRVGTVVAGLAQPWGVAVDPLRAGRVYVAERAFGGVGRVASIDLATRSKETLLPAGQPFEAPTALAIERGEGVLHVLCQPGGGPVFQVASYPLGRGATAMGTTTMPTGATSLAAGPDHLLLAAMPTARDLAVRGGLQQRRTIVAFDGPRHTATVATPFAPLPGPRSTWRLTAVDPFFHPRTGGTTRDDRFVWDSREAPGNGSVVLRAQAIDTEFGTAATASGAIPRANGFVQGPVPLLPGAVLDFADIDGDGALDLLAPGTSIFRQTAPGTFATTPLATLPAAADPIGVDVDGDGRCDVVGGGAVLTVSFQTAAGGFTNVTLTTNENLSAVADVDGDGLIDVLTMTGQLFRQGPARTFQPTTVAGLSSLGRATPTDANGDGRLDFVLSGAFGTGPAVMLATQQAGGTFSSTPLLTPSGSSFVAMVHAVGDFDGDGRLDPAAVFYGPPGSDELRFAGRSFAEAVQPGIVTGIQRLECADIDGDGRTDLLLQRAGENGALLQVAPGTFRYETIAPVGALRVADVDGDGRLDLANTDQLRLASSVRRSPRVVQLGGPLIDEFNQFVGVMMNGDVAVIDSGDGTLDVVASTIESLTDSGNDIMFRQGPAGSFAAGVLIRSFFTNFVGDQHGIDLEGDGSADLAVATSPLFGTSGGLFLPRNVQSNSVQVSLALVSADLDGDGDLDFATANRGTDNVAVFVQQAGAIAAPILLGGPGVTNLATDLAAGDFDSDGRTDLAVGIATGIAIYRQKQDGTLGVPRSGGTPLPDQILAGPTGNLGVGDFDGDGRADIAVTGSGNVLLFLQSASGSMPAVPSRVLTGVGGALGADLDGNGLDDLGGISYQVAPGVFVFSSAFAATAGGSQESIVADLDGDGDLDLVGVNPTRVAWRGR